MLKKAVIILVAAIAASACYATTLYAARYNSRDPLRVSRVELCLDKPNGYGQCTPLENGELGRNDLDVYIYVEVANCKPVRDAELFRTTLALDMDIYYNDGTCIYSEDEVKVSDNASLASNSNSYIWTKIDTRYLKEGEYKIEMTVRDENSKKEAFALTRFTKIGTPPAGVRSQD